jgi:hypothetical protein
MRQTSRYLTRLGRDGIRRRERFACYIPTDFAVNLENLSFSRENAPFIEV